MRWIVLGLSAHGLAAGLLLTNVLSSTSERGPAPEPARTAEFQAPTGEGHAARREPMRGLEPESALETRVRHTAEALAAALEAPGFEDVRWREQVAGHARTLGPAALPALEALLEDDSRSVEERVAATELVAALKVP